MFVPNKLTMDPGATGELKLPAPTILRLGFEQIGKFDAVTTRVTFNVDGLTVMLGLPPMFRLTEAEYDPGVKLFALAIIEIVVDPIGETGLIINQLGTWFIKMVHDGQLGVIVICTLCAAEDSPCIAVKVRLCVV
jgi:hypothetical protein